MVSQGNVSRLGHALCEVVFPFAHGLLFVLFRTPHIVLEDPDVIRPMRHTGAVDNIFGGVRLPTVPATSVLGTCIASCVLPGSQNTRLSLVIDDLVFGP